MYLIKDKKCSYRVLRGKRAKNLFIILGCLIGLFIFLDGYIIKCQIDLGIYLFILWSISLVLFLTVGFRHATFSVLEEENHLIFIIKTKNKVDEFRLDKDTFDVVKHCIKIRIGCNKAIDNKGIENVLYLHFYGYNLVELNDIFCHYTKYVHG